MKRLLPILLALLATTASGYAQSELPFFIVIEATSDSTAKDSIRVVAIQPSVLSFVAPEQDGTIHKVAAAPVP